ncbi:MAG: RHS repeat-associated core domain-containing protein [Cytophagales bacterium]|nr:RHS repeat-associated core domain-containing protein [Cytophagales bacterium]
MGCLKIPYRQEGIEEYPTLKICEGLDEKEGARKKRIDYYPFGLTFNSSERSGYTSNLNLYQGKEWQQDLGLNTYDFHARMYDPALLRTFQQDPLGEKYYPFSPYSWVANNPLIITDPTGMELDWSQLKGREHRNERRQFRKAFREIKRSGKTAKAIVGQIEQESGREITDFGNDKTARAYGRNAFRNKSSKGFYENLLKWQSEQTGRYKNTRTNSKIPVLLKKLIK